jgi:hypothetical protein
MRIICCTTPGTVPQVPSVIVAPSVHMGLGEQGLVQPLPSSTIRTEQRLRGNSEGPGCQEAPECRFVTERKEPLRTAREGQELASGQVGEDEDDDIGWQFGQGHVYFSEDPEAGLESLVCGKLEALICKAVEQSFIRRFMQPSGVSLLKWNLRCHRVKSSGFLISYRYTALSNFRRLGGGRLSPVLEDCSYVRGGCPLSPAVRPSQLRF